MDGELGVIGCKRLLLEGISKEILLCSTEDEVESLMMEHDNGTKTNYTRMGNWVTMLDSGKNCLGEITIKKHPTNTPLEAVIKPQELRTREDGKRPTKPNLTQLITWP